MKPLGKTTIQTFEEPDHLLFIVTREKGWIGGVAIFILLVVFVFFIWPDHKLFVIFGLVAGIFGWVASYSQGNITRLIVSEHEVIASGNLDRTFTTAVTIPTSEIKSIGYFIGREGDPNGLYIRHYIYETCVLPGLDADEAETITTCIRQRYPSLEQGDTNPNSMLFPGDGGITRLNLTS